MRVLAIGECMAELVPSMTPGDYRLGFAGDTFNTAWYLARVAPQVAVGYLTAVGDDPLSRDLIAFMRQSGIDTDAVRHVPDRTLGLYLIALQNGERSFSYWRGQSAARALADDPAHLARAMAGADLIYVSGITLAILAADARERLLVALDQARAGGKAVAFDPNLRPRLWDSASAMQDAVMQGAACATIALPSFEDEATWFQDADPEATLTRYLQAGCETVIVKNGPAPVLCADADARHAVPVAPLAEVTDTTAAGDSFNAGFIAARAAGMALPEAIAYGCALAREVVQHRGALVQATLPTLP